MEGKKRVMVFGVFDRLHDGHRSFLKQAEKNGNEFIVVVARDAVVRELKHRTPLQTERQRAAALRRVPGVWKVILGDKIHGSYGVVKKWKPDVICVGYDQKELLKDIKHNIKKGVFPPLALYALKAYNPRIFHSSFQNSYSGRYRYDGNHLKCKAVG